MKQATVALFVIVSLSALPLGAAGPDVVVRSGPAIKGGSGSWNYTVTTDATGASYAWIDATGGTVLGSGDDDILSFNFPFDFQVYDDTYTTTDVIEVNTNGSVHFDQGGPRTVWVNCGDIPSTGDGQWVAPLGDDLVASNIWYLVTGTAPNRILTIEFQVNEYSGGGTAMLEVNLYEGSNVIVVQTQITNAFTFSADGVVGINAGDGIWGTEVACGADGTLPSDDFDVEFVPQGTAPTPTAPAAPAVPATTPWGLVLFLVSIAGVAVLLIRRHG